MLTGFNLVFLDEVDSTNVYALKRVEEFEQHSVVISRIQTAGRGRRGRQWDSSIEGNLYMSLVEKHPLPSLPLHGFTQLMALAAASACHVAGAEARIKWPNDIFVQDSDGRKKKIGGILSESRFSGDSCSGLVVGLGLNIVGMPHLTPPSSPNPETPRQSYEIDSLNNHLPRPTSRNRLLPLILDEYARRYPVFLRQGYGGIAAEYEQLLIPADFYFQNARHSFAGINARGELQGRSPSAALVTVSGGDVVLVIADGA